MAVRINARELENLLAATPASQNIMLTGKHGIGKSQILEKFFTAHGERVVILFLGQMSDPGDLIGLPRLDEMSGKTLAKNLGRVFGMGLASLAVIGGAFSGIFYLVASRFPAAFNELAGEFAELAAKGESNIPEMLTNPASLMVIASVVAGVIVWNIIHGAFVRPFILTGVLRNYLQSGMDNIPDEQSLAMLDSKSAKFAKLHGQLA